MGVWGSGLYSDDFAMDLRSTVSAVVRLPYDADKLVDILSESEAGAAANPEDENHATFWLVVADQFAKRGIVSSRARDKALAIIDSDAGGIIRRKLGTTPAGLGKRRRMLEQLRAQITNIVP